MIKLSNCGCGGEAMVNHVYRSDVLYICCPECLIETTVYTSLDEASEAWNTAMSRNAK